MPIPEPRTSHDDDELPGLPSIGSGAAGADEENASDLAIDDDAIDDSGGEDVGLDAATGVDDDTALGEIDEGDESLDGWDAAEEPVGEDPELDGEDEGGWTDGSEAAEAPGWDGDLDPADLDAQGDEPAARVDQGEEGVEERWEPGGDDDAPESASARDVRREEELADDLDLEDEGEIEGPAEERIEHPALALPELDRARVAWRWLGPEDDAIVAIGGGLAAGRSIYRVDGERAEPLADDPLLGETATSIAHLAGDAPAWIVGLRIGGALRSTDGARFERLEGLRGDAAVEVLAEPHASGTRLWARTRGGAISRSDDARAWSRPLIAGSIHAIARAEGGGVVALAGARHGGPLQVMRTADGGRGWRSTPGPTIPELPDEAELRVVAHGPHVVIACDAPGIGPFVSSDEGHSWRVIDPIRDAVALATAREGGAIALYAAVLCEGLDRGLVVRVPLEGDRRAEIVLDLDAVRRKHHVAGAGDSEGDQRVHALLAEEGAGGTQLWIGSGLGVVRALVRGPR